MNKPIYYHFFVLFLGCSVLLSAGKNNRGKKFVVFSIKFRSTFLNNTGKIKLLKKYKIFLKRLQSTDKDVKNYRFWVKRAKFENSVRAKEFLFKAKKIKEHYKFTRYYKLFN